MEHWTLFFCLVFRPYNSILISVVKLCSTTDWKPENHVREKHVRGRRKFRSELHLLGCVSSSSLDMVHKREGGEYEKQDILSHFFILMHSVNGILESFVLGIFKTESVRGFQAKCMTVAVDGYITCLKIHRYRLLILTLNLQRWWNSEFSKLRHSRLP